MIIIINPPGHPDKEKKIPLLLSSQERGTLCYGIVCAYKRGKRIVRFSMWSIFTLDKAKMKVDSVVVVLLLIV